MRWLQLLSFRTRIYILAVVAALGLLGMAATSVLNYQRTLMDARLLKTQHLVESAASLIETIAEQTEDVDAAKQRAMQAVKGMRYGDGKEYFWINDMQPVMVMHPMKPELDGKPLADMADPNGKRLFMEMVKVVKARGGGFVDYMWPKGADKIPQPKMSYVMGYQPWGWVIGSGIYVDDVQAEMWHEIRRMGLMMLAILAVMVGVSFVVSRSMRLALGDMIVMFGAMAQFDFKSRVAIEGNNEISKVSKDLGVVLDGLCKVVREVRMSAEQMAAAAQELSSSSGVVRDVSTQQQKDIEDISTEVSNASEMTAQINMRVNNAREKVEHIAEVAHQADMTMQQLQDMARKVSDASAVINDISEQINLLALNAAIEAARAGDAGRGFAVVADEVRKLAANTSNSVQQIGSVMNDLQNVVGRTSSELKGIAQSILQVREDVNLVAHDMDEQARSIQNIAENVGGFTGKLSQMTHSISETTDAANSVAAESFKLSQDMARFKV